MEKDTNLIVERHGTHNRRQPMELLLRFFLPFRRRLQSVLLSLCLLGPLDAAWATQEVSFSFENTDIQVVIKKVGELAGTTFLFDPEKVKGKITLLAPQKVSAEGGLQLLQSALALQGYVLRKKDAGTWVVPAAEPAPAATAIEVVALHYAKAAEVAETLSRVAPPGVRIVPYYPTNSLLIAGNPEAVAEVSRILREHAQESKGR
jgi:general secretion pathway protein D